MHIFEDIAHDSKLFVSTDNGERELPSKSRDVFSQDSHAEGMERRKVAQAGARFSDEVSDALAEFARGFIRKADGDDLLRSDVPRVDEVSDAMGDNSRFSASSASENEHWSFVVHDGFELLRIE